jgi:hypothetical protein
MKKTNNNPGNPHNPYDGIGLAHNFLMEYINHHHGKSIRKASNAQKKRKLIEARTLEAIRKFYGHNSISPKVFKKVCQRSRLVSSVNYKQFLIKNKFSNKDKKILINYVTKLSHSNLQELEKIENKYLSHTKNRSNLTVLAAMSVGRYSLSLHGSRTKHRKILPYNVAEIIEFDIIGSLLGSVFGWWGALAGAIVGSIVATGGD